MFELDAKQTLIDHASGKFPRRGKDLSKAAREVVERPMEASLSPAVVIGLAQFIEAVVLVGLGFAIYASYVGETGGLQFYLGTIAGSVVLANMLFNAAETHSIAAYRSVTKSVLRALAAWSTVFLIVVAAVFLIKAQDEVSRVWLVSWYVAGGIAEVAMRLCLKALVRHWTESGLLKRRTVIVGGGSDAERLIDAINANRDSDIEIFGLFDDRVDERSPEQVAGCPKLGRVGDLAEFARRTRVDLVIVSMPLSAEKRVLHMLKQLWVLPVDIRLSTHMSQLKFTRNAYSYVGGVPVFDVADRPISDWNLVFKWLFDKSVALASVVLLSPLLVAVAIAVKLDSKGPILFRQRRHGFNNELIDVLKFRSMYADQADADAVKQATRDDPRVTRVGRFIRKTSIDELPQLFNVLMGQLSIVGPRPHALQAKADNKLYFEAVDGYYARHRVKPGITGWAQIHGWRGETDTLDKIEQRVGHDLYYIENWSVFLDMYILMMTPVSLVTQRENAY